MAPVHGKSAKLFWGGFDLTSFGKEITSEGTADVADDTAFGDNSKSYIPGLKDGTLSAGGIYEAQASGSAQVLEGILGIADSEICYLPEGDAISKLGYGLLSIPTKVAVSSPIDNIVAWNAEAQSSVGKEQILSLHALTQETITGNGANVDHGAATTGGLSGYLQVTDVTAGTLDVKIQHSVDNSVWVDLITFTQATADNVAERKAVSGTVNRHLRYVRTIATGPATFFVGASRTPHRTS